MPPMAHRRPGPWPPQETGSRPAATLSHARSRGEPVGRRRRAKCREQQADRRSRHRRGRRRSAAGRGTTGVAPRPAGACLGLHRSRRSACRRRPDRQRRPRLPRPPAVDARQRGRGRRGARVRGRCLRQDAVHAGFDRPPSGVDAIVAAEADDRAGGDDVQIITSDGDDFGLLASLVTHAGRLAVVVV